VRRAIALITIVVSLAATGWPRLSLHAADPSATTLRGNVLPILSQATPLGPVDTSQRLTIAIGLRLRNEAALHHFLAQVTDPASSLFGQYLSRDQFVAEFSPTPEQEQAVSEYLQSQGLTITQHFANRLRIDASGTAGQIERAFGITIERYRASAPCAMSCSRTFFANSGPPHLPASIASFVATIDGLQSYIQLYPHLTHTISAHVGSGPGGGYSPADIRAAYNFGPLYSAGGDGTGQTVALYELASFQASNIDTYDRQFGLTPGPLITVPVDGGTTSTYGQDEVELDIEIVQALALHSSVLVYEGPNGGPGIDDTYTRIVADDRAQVISTSWGACEAAQGASELQYEDMLFQEAAAQGQAIFAASGDNGAYDCGSYTNFLNVDSPASDPYITGAGGTSLMMSNGSYGSESAWGGSGGGLSLFFTRPSWQQGPGVLNSASNGYRQVTDVAADANPYTGWSIYTGGAWWIFGGTSCAAPLWAAFAADANTYAALHKAPPLGFANPRLYRLTTTLQPYTPFHDVTMGSNGYYAAAPNWDYPTGWGSPNAWNLARDLAAVPPPNSIATATPTPTAIPSLTPTRTVVATPTATRTLIPTRTPTATSSPTATRTPTPQPTATTANLIINGGFEEGSDGWTFTGSPRPTVTTQQAHSGAHSALLGQPIYRFQAPANNQISQTVILPSNASSITLTFWYTLTCANKNAQAQASVIAGGTTIPVLKACITTSGWRQVTANLTAYAGDQATILFADRVSSYGASQLFIDDVSVIATTDTTPPATPLPTATSTMLPSSTPTATPTPSPTPTTTTPPASGPDQYQQELLTLINNSRAKLGLPPYTFSLVQSHGTSTCVGSYGHSVHMEQEGYLSHDQFPADICIPFFAAGENVGYATGPEAQAIQYLHNLMMSEGPGGGHYDNIMNPYYTTVGLGLYYVNGALWLTEDFVG
jgi:uncharacterized protein YkwD